MLSENLLKSHQNLEKTKYFTARITASPDKERRQTVFIEALETLPNFEIFFGKYQFDPKFCMNCGSTNKIPDEKMTDVNIAVELITDTYENNYDMVLLISADSDLSPVLKKIKKIGNQKRIVLAFPPNRSSKELMKYADAYFTIGHAILSKSVFPEYIHKPNGITLQRPSTWK